MLASLSGFVLMVSFLIYTGSLWGRELLDPGPRWPEMVGEVTFGVGALSLFWNIRALTRPDWARPMQPLIGFVKRLGPWEKVSSPEARQKNILENIKGLGGTSILFGVLSLLPLFIYKEGPASLLMASITMIACGVFSEFLGYWPARPEPPR